MAWDCNGGATSRRMQKDGRARRGSDGLGDGAAEGQEARRAFFASSALEEKRDEKKPPDDDLREMVLAALTHAPVDLMLLPRAEGDVDDSRRSDASTCVRTSGV